MNGRDLSYLVWFRTRKDVNLPESLTLDIDLAVNLGVWEILI